MPVIDRASHEIRLKIVLVGPTGGGKVELAHLLYESAPEAERGSFIALDTKEEPSVLFELSRPWKEPGFRARMPIWTLPEPVGYRHFRRLVAKGFDAWILVTREVSDALAESVAPWQKLLQSWSLDPRTIPLVTVVHGARNVPRHDAASLEAQLRRESLVCFEVPWLSPEVASEAVSEAMRLVSIDLTRARGEAPSVFWTERRRKGSRGGSEGGRGERNPSPARRVGEIPWDALP